MTIQETISAEDARCFYDRLGAGHDLGHRFERAAKNRGLQRLTLRPGLHVLNVGVGTGKEQLKIQQAIAPGGVAYGVDLSRTMLRLSHRRVPPPGNNSLCEADGRRLPFPDAAFDRAFSSYVLDLIPAPGIHQMLAEMRRVLRPDGRLVLVSLTEGATLPSRALVAAWKAFYHVSPYALGGCRPVRLTYPLLRAGFSHVDRELVVQLGMPSEILVARP